MRELNKNEMEQASGGYIEPIVRRIRDWTKDFFDKLNS